MIILTFFIPMDEKLYFPGEIMCEIENKINGHGTYIRNKSIVSSYLGYKRQIDRLITSVPKFSFKYKAQIGDIVIGRVIDINNRKWIIDGNITEETSLNINGINIPGLEQRKKLELEEINMKKYIDINEVVICEVQKLFKSGQVALHMRNEKYGKAENGILIKVIPNLIAPMKNRFLLMQGMKIVVGMNGFVWIEHSCGRKGFLMVSHLSRLIQDHNVCQLEINIEALVEQTIRKISTD